MSERVLYMEDDDAQARLVQKCLQRAGYAVDLAADGAAGLAACAATAYDAVIVDQTMPGLSGLEVIRAMAARGPLPPTVVVTGTGSERIAVEAMKLGVSDYLVKDLEGGFVNVLPLVVARAIQQRRLLEEKQRMEKELVRLQRLEAIGQLAAGIAHEINTPTQYIGDNTRFLQGAFADIGTVLDAFDRLLHAAQAGSGHRRAVEGNGGRAPQRRPRLPQPRNPPGHPAIAGRGRARLQHRRRNEGVLPPGQRAETADRSEPRHRGRHHPLPQRMELRGGGGHRLRPRDAPGLLSADGV